MHKAVSLSDILNELREIKERVRHIEEAVEELIDLTLTSEEEEMLKEVREKIEKGDFSDFVALEKLDEVLKE